MIWNVTYTPVICIDVMSGIFYDDYVHTSDIVLYVGT